MKKLIISILFLFCNILITNAQSVSLGTSAVNPTKGTIIFDSNSNLLKYWNGSAWIPIQNGASSTGWVLNGANIYNNNTGNVGIGTTAPARKLEVNSGVENESGVRISKLANPLTQEKTWPVTSAIAVVFSDAATMYVNSFTENKIQKIVNEGTPVDFVTSGLDGPQDIILGADGYLYVSNFNSGTVVKIDGAGNVTTYAAGFSNPTGLAFDNSGNLFVSNAYSGIVSKISAGGGSVNYNFITGLTSPYGCVFDPLTNKLFIANYGANEIAQADATVGGIKTTFKSGVTGCTGITRNSNGDLFVALAALNKIVKINPFGIMADVLNTTYPLDVIIDNNDNFYVANQTLNEVAIYKTKNEFNSLLSVDTYGDIKKANLAKNGYKLYLDDISSNKLGIFAKSQHSISSPGFPIIYNNYGILGGEDNGVLGFSDRSTGVYGESENSYGVEAYSKQGTALFAFSGSGNAGYFQGNVSVTGNLCAANVTCPSDLRLKKDVVPLSSSIHKLNNIKGYNYYWNDKSKSQTLQTGVIAQDLQKVFPELVNEEKDGYLSVNYTGLIPHLLEAVKELKNENEAIKTENEALKKEIFLRIEALENSLKQASIK